MDGSKPHSVSGFMRGKTRTLYRHKGRTWVRAYTWTMKGNAVNSPLLRFPAQARLA